MADLDPERALALAYVPARRQPALAALWRLDAALGTVLATGTEPMVTRIRLAWWREALERLDREAPPAEPLLEAIAAHVLPAGIRGVDLAAMVEGWDAIVGGEAPDAEALSLHAGARGGALFRLSGRLLGGAVDPGIAGEKWALVDLARRSGRPEESRAALAAARDREQAMMWPAMLRPLGMLSVLASRDLKRGAPERQGGPIRLVRMIFHRISGR